MISTLFAAALAFAPVQASGKGFVQAEMPNPYGGMERLLFRVEERLDVPKLSPKKFNGKSWEFDWLTNGFAQRQAGEGFLIRFRVFSQQRAQENDLAEATVRLQLRLLDYNLHTLGLDHNPNVNLGVIDTYLCWGGKPGGEQLLGSEIVNGRTMKVNTIYIYDLASFTDPVERAREVSHEYGHAVFPPVGGFKTPEDWANGYLGERIFLNHLRDAMSRNLIGPEDAMGASAAGITAWAKKNVDPLVLAAATAGPDLVLSGTGQKAMNAYMGMALFANAIFPGRTFVRSMVLAASARAVDYPRGILLAIEEPNQIKLSIPAILRGRPIWVPVGAGKLTGATILGRKSGWVKVRPGTASLTIINRP